MADRRYTVLVEIEWDFNGEDADWQWLNANANFAHRDACEFIVHVGSDNVDSTNLSEYARNTAKAMQQGGCSAKLITTYLREAKRGAERILFWK